MSTAVCEPCRIAGHFCPASNVIEGETPKCIFCEDGERCPHGRQKPSQAPAALTGDSYGEHVVKVESANRQVKRNREQSRRQQELMAAGVAHGEAVRRAQKDVPSVSAKVAAHQEETMDTTNECGRDGCGKKLTKANHGGFCAKHFYDSKRKAGGTASSAPRAKTRPRLLADNARRAVAKALRHVTEPAAATVGSLLVSEEQLVRMFTAWPLEDKLSCVQRHLDGERA